MLLPYMICLPMEPSSVQTMLCDYLSLRLQQLNGEKIGRGRSRWLLDGMEVGFGVFKRPAVPEDDWRT